jgi:putative transposase
VPAFIFLLITLVKNAGIEPAPRRIGPAWSKFLRSRAETILACDFFTADLLDGTQAYVRAVIHDPGSALTPRSTRSSPTAGMPCSGTCGRPA